MGRDWRFVLRADARTISDRLQEGITLLAQHRKLSGELSPPWPDAVVSACKYGLTLLQQRRETFGRLSQPWSADIVEEMQKGLALIGEIAHVKKQLSVQYSEQIEQLNVPQLQREWTQAEKAMWPMSGLSKRKIRKTLDVAITGEGEPDIAKDLRLWVKVRGLRSEVSALEISPATDGVWAGLKTRPEFAQCALNLRQALASVRSEQPWEDTGFEPIANGRCGEHLAAELSKLRTLKTLDAELKTLNTSVSPRRDCGQDLRLVANFWKPRCDSSRRCAMFENLGRFPATTMP